MSKRYDFKLTPAYCLYNGVAVLEQKGAAIRFLVENKDDELVCGRLSRAFENHIENIRRLKDYPEEFNRLIKIDFESGTRVQLRKCISNLYRAGEKSSATSIEEESGKSKREAAAVLLLLGSVIVYES